MASLARLNFYDRRYKHLFIPGLLCAVISSGFAIIVPMVVRQAIDSIPRFVTSYRAFQGTPLEYYLYTDYFFSLLTFGLMIMALSVGSGIFS